MRDENPIMSPLKLLRLLFRYENTITDYQMVTLIYEEFLELRIKEKLNLKPQPLEKKETQS